MYKKFLLLISTFVIGLSSVYAFSDSDYILEERTTDNNYGVNKSITITNSNKDNILSVPYVDSGLKVYDFANVIDDATEYQLRYEVLDLVNSTGMDFAFVFADLSSFYSDYDFENYAADFYDYNDFGINDKTYSGCIFVRDVVGRRDDIVCTGEAQIMYDQDRFDEINDYIDSDIRTDSYGETVEDLITEFNYYYTQGLPSSANYRYVDENGEIVYKFRPPYVACAIAGAIATAIIIGIFIAKNKMVRLAKDADKYLDKDSITYSVKEDRFINSHTTSYHIDRSSGGGGHGGSFHGSSGISHSSGGVHHR